MADNKQRVFLAARKRGIDIDIARRVCRLFGMAPTLGEEPVQQHLLYTDKQHPYIIQDDDPRDCDRKTADKAVAFIVRHGWCLQGGGWPKGWDHV